MNSWFRGFEQFINKKILNSWIMLLVTAGILTTIVRSLHLLKWDNSIPRILLLYSLIFVIVWLLQKVIQIEFKAIKMPSEIILVFAAHILLGIFVYRMAGGPNNWDEFLYLYTAKFAKPTEEILWRYTHIYLLQIALLFHPENVYLAGRLLWAFLISGTSFTIYWSIRTFSSSRVVIAAGTCLLFLSMPYLRYAGFIYADFTVMFFLSIGVWLFLLIQNRGPKNGLLLFMFGLICFLAFNAKEIGISLLLLVPSFGFEDGTNFHFSKAVRRAIPVILGIISGLILFMILDGLILNDFFFHVNPDHWKSWLLFNTSQSDLINKVSFLGFLSQSPITLLLICSGFAFIGEKSIIRQNRGLLFIYTIPIFILIFTAFLKFQVFERYTFPVYPILYVLFALFLMQYHDSPKLFRWFVISTSIYLFISLMALQLIPGSMLQKPDVVPLDIRMITTISIGAMLILIIITFNTKFRLSVAAFVITTFVCGMFFIQNLNSWKYGYTVSLFNKRFSPLIDFRPASPPTKNSTIWVSPTIAEKRGMLAEHDNIALWILSTYYQVDIPMDNILYAEWNPSNPVVDQTDYIYIDQSEWAKTLQPEKEDLLENYSASSVSNEKIIVLEKLH